MLLAKPTDSVRRNERINDLIKAAPYRHEGAAGREARTHSSLKKNVFADNFC